MSDQPSRVELVMPSFDFVFRSTLKVFFSLLFISIRVWVLQYIAMFMLRGPSALP